MQRSFYEKGRRPGADTAVNDGPRQAHEFILLTVRARDIWQLLRPLKAIISLSEQQVEGFCVLIGIVTAIALVVWLAAKPDKIRLFDGDRGGANTFTVFQEFVEPTVKHVNEVREQNRKGAETGPPGYGT